MLTARSMRLGTKRKGEIRARRHIGTLAHGCMGMGNILTARACSVSMPAGFRVFAGYRRPWLSQFYNGGMHEIHVADLWR